MLTSIMRRWLPVCVLLLGLLLATRPSAAAEAYPTIVPSLPDIQLYGTAGMAPLQPLAELLGITASIDTTKGIAQAKRGDHTVVFYHKSTTAAQDGAIVPVPMAAYVTASGLFYVPVQTLIEGLGGTYTCDTTRASATITLPEREKALILPCVKQQDPKQLFQDNQPALYAVNIDGSNLRRLTFDSGSTGLPVFVPNSTKFFYSHNGVLVQRSAEDQTEYPLPKPEVAADERRPPYQPCSVSADGKLLLFTNARYGNLSAIYTLHRGEVAATTVSREALFPSMNAAGDTIACLRMPENLDKNDPFSIPLYLMATDGSNRRLIADKAYARFTPVFSPDGSLLAYQRTQMMNEQRRIRTMNVLYQVTGAQAGKVYDIPWNEVKGMEGDIAFSPDNQWMAIAGDGLRIMKPDRSQAKLLVTYFTKNPLFTPDGKQLLYTAGTMIRSINRDGSQDHLILQGAGVVDLILTPDGQQILFHARPFTPAENVQREEW